MIHSLTKTASVGLWTRYDDRPPFTARPHSRLWGTRKSLCPPSPACPHNQPDAGAVSATIRRHIHYQHPLVRVLKLSPSLLPVHQTPFLNCEPADPSSPQYRSLDQILPRSPLSTIDLRPLRLTQYPTIPHTSTRLVILATRTPKILWFCPTRSLAGPCAASPCDFALLNRVPRSTSPPKPPADCNERYHHTTNTTQYYIPRIPNVDRYYLPDNSTRPPPKSLSILALFILTLLFLPLPSYKLSPYTTPTQAIQQQH